MKITDQAKALYELIGNNSILFDHNSYESEYDIPYIRLDSRKMMVHSVHFCFGGNGLMLNVKDTFIREVIVRFDYNPQVIEENFFEKNLEMMNIDSMFKNMYFETEESNYFDSYDDFLAISAHKQDVNNLSKNEMIADMCRHIKDNTFTTSWEFPDNTKVKLFLYDEEVETELFTLFLHYNPRNAETYLMLHSCDDKRGEDMYDENLEHFSTEEVREIYKIFRANI